ncbi:hypothetical protein FBU30_003658 [Linnemannia zychae]|nr:hypothetical protein FBU30_003658 [Linnemannia zychae]
MSLASLPSSSAATAAAPKSRTASTKRRVRFTFGYSSRTPSFCSLPPSPTDLVAKEKSSDFPTTSSSTQPNVPFSSTSLPIMHTPSSSHTNLTSTTTPEYSSNDKLSTYELSPSVSRTRTNSTSSIASATSTLTPPSRPTSRCSINSGFSYTSSLDHRTMHRPSNTASYKHSSGASSTTSSPTSASQTQPTTPASAAVTARRPSVVERSAFLASAPIRSRAQISPRLKNMSPAPSTSTFLSNHSFPSLTSRESRASTSSNFDGEPVSKEEDISLKKKKIKKAKKSCTGLALFSFMLKK